MQKYAKQNCSIDFIHFLRRISKKKHLFTSWNRADK